MDLVAVSGLSSYFFAAVATMDLVVDAVPMVDVVAVSGSSSYFFAAVVATDSVADAAASKLSIVG